MFGAIGFISLFDLLTLAALFIAAGILGECEWPSLGSFIFIGGLVGLEFFTDLKVLTYAYHNPFSIVAGLLIYIVAGVIWSHVKWRLFLHDVKDYYKQILTQVQASKSYKGDEVDAKFAAKRDTVSRFNVEDIPPRASRKKLKITGWIMYWPISIIWSIADDFILRLFNRIFELIRGSYQNASDSVFKDV